METVPTSFHWTDGGSSVFLVGSFSQWREYIPMIKEPNPTSSNSNNNSNSNSNNNSNSNSNSNSNKANDTDNGQADDDSPSRKVSFDDSEDSVFSVTIDLAPGIHSYKFIVDGVWRYAPDQPILPDQRGNINNCCAISLLQDSGMHRYRNSTFNPTNSILKLLFGMVG
jgi:hypothetical protein